MYVYNIRYYRYHIFPGTTSLKLLIGRFYQLAQCFGYLISRFIVI